MRGLIDPDGDVLVLPFQLQQLHIAEYVQTCHHLAQGQGMPRAADDLAAQADGIFLNGLILAGQNDFYEWNWTFQLSE